MSGLKEALDVVAFARERYDKMQDADLRLIRDLILTEIRRRRIERGEIVFKGGKHG